MTTVLTHKGIDFSLADIFSPYTHSISWVMPSDESYSIKSASMSTSVKMALAFLTSIGIKIDNINDVESFLTNYYGIVAHLYDVPGKISEYFGNSNVIFGLFVDPDSTESIPELYFEVETSLSPEVANEKLSKINREWLLKLREDDLSFLNITLKFN